MSALNGASERFPTALLMNMKDPHFLQRTKLASLLKRNLEELPRLFYYHHEYRGPFIKGFEVDDNFAVDIGVRFDNLALPEEVQLIFTYRKWS